VPAPESLPTLNAQVRQSPRRVLRAVFSPHCEATQHLCQWHTNWLAYRATSEALKREKYTFLGMPLAEMLCCFTDCNDCTKCSGNSRLCRERGQRYKREKYTFLGQAAKYSGIPADEAKKLLVERVEEIVSLCCVASQIVTTAPSAAVTAGFAANAANGIEADIIIVSPMTAGTIV
jgi:hypothetical protein